jgi:hypothetical protein
MYVFCHMVGLEISNLKLVKDIEKVIDVSSS